MRLVLACIACGVLVLSGLSPASAATKVVVFKPTGKAQTMLIGSCWTTSIASRRSDAFRCMVKNEIFDPCFAGAKMAVECPEKGTVVQIKLTKKLPAAQLSGKANPYAMMLAGSIRCNIGTGTIVMGYPYFCRGNLVCTAPRNADGYYTVNCGTPSSATKVVNVRKISVTTLWM